MANVICKSINQPMVMLEACRVLLCLLALTTRPQDERAAAVQALHDAASKAAQEAGAIPDENGEIPGAEPDPEALASAAYGELHSGFYGMLYVSTKTCHRRRARTSRVIASRLFLSHCRGLVPHGNG